MQLSLLLNQCPILETMLSTHIPAKARSIDPETSHQAAQSWTVEKLTRAQLFALTFFLSKGSGNDRELEAWVTAKFPNAHFGPSTLRKRRGDLVEMGIVKNSGSKRDGLIVREIVEKEEKYGRL